MTTKLLRVLMRELHQDHRFSVENSSKRTILGKRIAWGDDLLRRLKERCVVHFLFARHFSSETLVDKQFSAVIDRSLV